MKRACILILAVAALTSRAAVLAGPANSGAQASTLPAPDAGQSVTLRGNTRPEANAANDRGRVADGLALNHMMLQLRRSAEQEQALQQFISEIHDPASSLFHHWITAEEFGERFGVAPADVATVTDWLKSQGFQVNLVYPNQMVIDFSGSAGQIRQAFRTEIHNLRVNGQAHIANMSDPQIPAELVFTVAGVVSLNDFRPHPTLHPRAAYTVADGYELIVPADLATIYNFNPAFAAGISGQGETVVVVEDTNIYSTTDWNAFRSTFGLASAYPLGSLAQIHPPSTPVNNCTDPGTNGNDIEATLDVEWASAAAPSAAIVLASCTDTATFGGFIALQNLLNANGTPPAVVSISYGESESYQGASINAYINSLYEQAVGQGVSVFVSSGDEGAASSDAGEGYAVSGITVSGFTSTPYNVSVGGTDFGDTYQGAKATYWNAGNTPAFGSARSYVPEIPWNDSCASVLIGDYLNTLPTYGSGGMCDKGQYMTTASGSGGPSGCATGAPDTPGVVGGTCAGFAKPAWQAGLIGNPSDGVRDIPDVSLFSANGVWGHYYAFCFSDPLWGYNCSGAPSTWAGAGGTSFASPIMAAVQALINQATGSRWGNPNPSYYSLAAIEYGSGGLTSCNSALGSAVAANCIFYDVTPLPLLHAGSGTGGDIDVPCLGMNCYAPSGTYGVLSTAPQILSSVSVTSLGGGYTSAPSCTLSGGGGSGAACTSSITGVVSSIALTNGGSGYTHYPIACTLTGGGGTGANCEAFICADGDVCVVRVANFGSGYTSSPTCTLSGGGGTGATCAATRTLGIATTLTAAGSGYSTMPHCVLSGGGGAGGTCAALADNTSDAYQPAFSATAGWDFATGIGTVNVANLVAGFGASAASFSTSGLNFSSQPLYTMSAVQSVTLTNTGTANLILTAVAIGGTNSSEFVKNADTCSGATLIINGTCSVSVTFTPSATGGRTASLIFTDFAPHTPQTVTLSGTGEDVGVELSPSSLNFPDQAPGTSSLSQTITLTNTGSVPLTFTSIGITGNNRGDFSQTNMCGSSLGVGGHCGINVTFAPAAAGSKSASLTITDNVRGSPQTLSLTGTGADPVPLIYLPLVPTSVAPGGSGFTLTVNGTGFASGATVNWNGVALATTFAGNEKLTATVPAAKIALPGTASISVGYTGSTLTSNVAFFPVATSATTAAFSNANGSPLAAGNDPWSIAVGDFNGDGKLDIAVANSGNNTLTILLGNGDGTFTPAASPATGSGPISVAVGDFNGDGKLDLVTANWAQNTVSVFLGNGDGTFAPANSFPTGDEPYSVAVGDFRGVGILDLAVANKMSNNLTILLGNGDGTFTPAATSPATGSSPMSVAVGDFNGDGKLDLAVAIGSGNFLNILLGNGDGTFTPAPSPTTGYDPWPIAVGDFNGDGKLDLAVGNVASSTVSILLGNGDGTFTLAASPATGSGPISVAVGDFNGDGKLDLAVANLSSNDLTILLGNGDGTFTPAASPATGKNPMAVAAGDFNGDGRLDLAAANGEANSISVLLQVPPTPVVNLSTSSLSFGNQTVTTTSSPVQVTVTNNGTTSLTFTNLAVTGDFAIAATGTTCGTSAPLAAGSHCLIAVTFTPTAPGARQGTLTLTDNNSGVPGSSQPVSLSGTGIPTLVITASSGLMTYGGTVPAINPSYVGFLTGDSPASLSSPPTCSATATSQSPVGSYPASCSGAVDSNYTISYVAGSVTIGNASLTIAASNGTMTYGGAPPAVTPGYSAFAGTDTVASLTTAPTCSTTVTNSTPVGAATGANTCSGAVDGNYTFIYVPGNVTVGKASLTITASNGTMTYGGTPPAVTPGYSAFAGTDTVASLTTQPTCTTTASAQSPAGSYPSTCSGAADPNYSFTYVAGNVAVEDFTLAPPSGSPPTVAPGQPASYTMTVGGQAGFSGTVSFTCSGVPSEATCTASPSPVTVGGSATNVTVTVTTTAPSLSTPRSRHLPPAPPQSPRLRGLFMLAMILAAMAWAIRRRRQPAVGRWQLRVARFATGALLSLALAGCGGAGGGGGGGGTPHDPGTPAGTYTLTVTGTAGSGSSAVSHSVTLTLTVS